MTNRNETGSVHYDSSTNQQYTEKRLAFTHNRREYQFFLKIPLKLRSVLKEEHYETAMIQARRAIDHEAMRMMRNGDFRTDFILASSKRAAHIAILEHLYNEFTLIQAQLGNQVWAVPTQMQRVGPPPEDDFRK